MARAASASHRPDDIFADRIRSRVELEVEGVDGESRVRRLHEEGALRVRFPHAYEGRREAVIVNTAGGVTGGDRISFDLKVGADAVMTVTTAAAEKVYRAVDEPAQMTVRLSVGPQAGLAWLPQETILFDRARFERDIDVTLADVSSLVLAEALVLGRAAMGEAIESGRVLDRWRVKRDGRLVFAETLRLDGAIAQKLAEPAIAQGSIAVATLLLAPGGDSQAATVRSVADRLGSELGVSAWNGICVVRLCAAGSAVLHNDMTVILSALGVPLPRLWLN